MRITAQKRAAAIILLVSFVFSFAGCGNKTRDTGITDTATTAPTENAASFSPAPAPTPTSTPAPTPTVAPSVSPAATENPIEQLTATQRNSINMLNWLAFLTQEINTANNNRVYIEEVYSLIVNETYPNAVDTRTQERLLGIRQALLRYRMVDVKRERIEFLYEQNKAQAIRAAIPNPLSVLNAVQSGSLAKLAMSVVYMAINSVSSYQSATSQAELQFLQDGWELDDEADDVFYTLRSEAFDYMLDIVREYEFAGDMALNEEAITEFVAWKNNTNITRRIQFLESNVDKYRGFGSYWLLLAESYYQNGDFGKCLEAIHSYEALSTRIFRHDNEYAKILPLVIVSAENVLPENKYIELAEKYTELILANIGTGDWALRYYAAQTYINLYAHTEDNSYLWKAYNILCDNVNYLIDEQIRLNGAYVTAVQEEPIPAGTTKDKQKQIENYNALLKEKRKTELPPVYEPLLANCDLLFAVADRLGISEEERVRVDNMLHGSGTDLFLVDLLDNAFRLFPKNDNDMVDCERASFDGKTICIPATWVSDNAVILVTVTNTDGTKTEFSDWTVTKVVREKENDVSTFMATYVSTSAAVFSYEPGAAVSVSIKAHRDYTTEEICLNYEAVDAKPNWYDHIGFWNSDIVFKKVK